MKFTRFRIEGKDWFDRAGQQSIYMPGQSFSGEICHFNGLLFNLCPPGKTFQRYLESGLQNLAQLRGIASGHPDAPLALGVETLA